MRNSSTFALFFLVPLFSSTALSYQISPLIKPPLCVPSDGPVVIGAAYTVGGGPASGQFRDYLNCTNHGGSNSCGFCIQGTLYYWDAASGIWVAQIYDVPGSTAYVVQCGQQQYVTFFPSFGNLPGNVTWEYVVDVWYDATCPNTEPDQEYTVQFST